MRTAAALTVAFAFFAQAVAAAGDTAAARQAAATVPGGLLACAGVEVVRSLNAGGEAVARSERRDLPRPRSAGAWVKRRPVWLGALIGAAVGTPIAHAKWGAEGAFVGFWGGAAAGAIAGAIIGR